MMEVCQNGGDGAPALLKVESEDPLDGGSDPSSSYGAGKGIMRGGKGGAAKDSGAAADGAVIHHELNAIIGQKRDLDADSELSPNVTATVDVVQPVGRGGGGSSSHTNGVAKPPLTVATKASTRGAANTRGGSASISKSIEEACHAAALEDGVLGSGESAAVKMSPRSAPAGAGGEGGAPAKPTKQKNGLRRGKWTPEEEAYANRLIVEFKSGLLPLTDGTTLRTFLSKLLNCDPMRISKKFVGSNCIGKQVFRRRQQADMDRLSTDDIEKSRQELSDLERKFLERVAQTNRCKNSAVLGKPGKDIGAGQVAPEMIRKNQEYSAPNGTNLPGPMIPPWMLPPSFASATGASGGGEGNGTVWGEVNRPPQHPSTTSKITPISQGLRRGTRNTSPDPVNGMPRTDSQDSLAALGRSLSANGLDLTDLPRNSSLGDLTSLNVFGGSPFPSTENLLSLGNTPAFNHPPNSTSNTTTGDWPPDSTGSNVTANAPAFFPRATEEAATSSSAASSSSSARPPVPQRSSDRLSKMTRVESATGLSQLRTHTSAGMSRNTSIDDFLSLVQNGDIPAPDNDMLSQSIFSAQQQQAKQCEGSKASVAAVGGGGGGGAGLGPSSSTFPAPQSAVAFTGIGKSSAVTPSSSPSGGDHHAVGLGRGKRARGVGAAGLAGTGRGGADSSSALAAKLKQPKMEK